MFRKSRADALLCGKLVQRSIRLPERFAVLITPCRVERLAVLLQAKRNPAFARDGPESISVIDILNPRDRRHLESRLAGVLIELQRTRANHSVLGDVLRRGEIAF